MRDRQTALDDELMGQLLYDACALFGDPPYKALSEGDRSYWKQAASAFCRTLIEHLARQAEVDDALGRICYEIQTVGPSEDWNLLGENSRSSWIRAARAVRLRVEAACGQEVNGLRRALSTAIDEFQNIAVAAATGVEHSVLALTAQRAAEEAQRANSQ